THSEGDRRDDHSRIVVDECRLVGAAFLAAQAGVIGESADPVFAQSCRELIDAPARQAVNDARPARAATSLQELGVAVLALRSHRVEEVRAIEARYVERRVAQLELL